MEEKYFHIFSFIISEIYRFEYLELNYNFVKVLNSYFCPYQCRQNFVSMTPTGHSLFPWIPLAAVGQSFATTKNVKGNTWCVIQNQFIRYYRNPFLFFSCVNSVFLEIFLIFNVLARWHLSFTLFLAVHGTEPNVQVEAHKNCDNPAIFLGCEPVKPLSQVYGGK